MLLQRALVGTGQHHEAAVLAGHALHGGPGAHDAVGWTEREVVQILVHGVAGRLITFAKTKGSQQRAQCYDIKPMCVYVGVFVVWVCGLYLCMCVWVVFVYVCVCMYVSASVRVHDVVWRYLIHKSMRKTGKLKCTSSVD